MNGGKAYDANKQLPELRHMKAGKESLAALSATVELDNDSPGGNSRDFVSSLARGLQILREFSIAGKKMTLSEVAARTGITRAATRRFLLTLVREGYATTDGKYFDLTTQVLELGYSVLSRMDIWQISTPYLEFLSQSIEESVSATVLDGNEVVYVSCVQYNRILSVGVAVGNRLPAYCTASGRVLIANCSPSDREAILKATRLDPRTKYTVTSKAKYIEILDRVYRDGYCLVDQELEVGLVSVAIPLVTLSGRVIGAVNVGCPTVRTSSQRMIDEILPALQETGEKIKKALPY